MNNSASVPSSRGLGRGPLKAKTRVRLPLGPPIKQKRLNVAFFVGGAQST